MDMESNSKKFDYSVEYCICKGLLFSDLKELAASEGIKTAEELGKLTEAGTKCTLCKPYLEEMLKTGKTVFRG